MPVVGEAGKLGTDDWKTQECGGRSEQLVVPRSEELWSDHPLSKYGDWLVQVYLK